MKLDFNQEWRVYPTPEPEEWNRPRTYEIVNLPHDYNISLETQKERSTGPAGGYYPGCSVEYEKDTVKRNKASSLAEEQEIEKLFDDLEHDIEKNSYKKDDRDLGVEIYD